MKVSYDDVQKKSAAGQAVVEYLLIMIFIYMVAGKFIKGFKDFLAEGFGTIGHAMTVNLSVGVCEKECFFKGYKNSNGK